MNRPLILLIVCSSMTILPAIGEGREGFSRGARMGPVYPYWSQFLHSRFAYEFPLPPGMRSMAAQSDTPASAFASSDGSFFLSAWGGQSTQAPASLLEEQWRTAERRSGRIITYRRRTASWFVVSGTERDGTEFYEKFLSQGNQVAAFTLRYPRSRLQEFEPWVEKIEDGFRIVTAFSRNPVSTRPGGPALLNQPTAEAEPGVADKNRTAPRSPPFQREVPLSSPPGRPPVPADPMVKPAIPGFDMPHRKPSPMKSVGPASPPPLDSDSPLPEKDLGAPPRTATNEIPTGAKVIGKPGFVYTPFSSGRELVDVVGIPSGTKVKCPYSNRVFRVP